MLNQAPTEDQLLNGADQTNDSIETASISPSTRSTITVSGMSTSLGATSLGATSSYSIKSTSSRISGVTLAPSSLSGSNTTSKTKSSLKKTPTKRYIPVRTTRDFSNLGYNKLRLDSAVSPKHSPRIPGSNSGEKVGSYEYFCL